MTIMQIVRAGIERRKEIIAETVEKVRTNFLIGRTMRPAESVAVPIMFTYCKESAEFAIDLTAQAVLALIDAKIAALESQSEFGVYVGSKEGVIGALPLLRELREEIVGLEGERPSCAEVEGLK